MCFAFILFMPMKAGGFNPTRETYALKIKELYFRVKNISHRVG